MELRNLFYTGERAAWREWLETYFETEKEVWFVYPLRGSGEPCLSYNDAVEEALCFGWIDSTNRRLDDLHRAQRFTPRKRGSAYSRPNIERLKWLDAHGMIHPKVRPALQDLLDAEFVFPEDIVQAIRQDARAWSHYTAFSEPYKRIRVAYIDAARNRPEEFQKRLASFLRKTREGKRIVGFGGVDKYYE